jgi:VWFA-related protein
VHGSSTVGRPIGARVLKGCDLKLPRLTSILILGGCFSLSMLAQNTPQSQPDSQQTPAQTPSQLPTLIPRTHEEREQRYQTLHRLVLNMQVRDQSGKPVTGLTADDFTLLEDGKVRKITSVKVVAGESASAPTHVILVLDGVNNSLRNIASDRKEIEKFLRGHRDLSYPTSIAVLTDTGMRMGKQSHDGNFLLEELRGLGENLHPIDCADEASANESFRAVWMTGGVSTPSSGHQLTCLNRRFVVSVTALERLAEEQTNTPGRAILIWVGAGWPLLHEKQFRPDDASLKQNLFAHLVFVSRGLREGQVTLDLILPASKFRQAELLNDHETALLNGVSTEDEVTAGNLGLQELAHQSGGQVLIESKDLPAGIAACIADADAYYVLSFDSSPTTEPAAYHAIEVRVDRPGVVVRTNTNYYAEP